MWSEGTIEIKKANGAKVPVHYWVKHYDEPSPWGIEKGKISKLTLEQDEETVYNYDRAADISAKTPEAKVALAMLIQKYN